MDIFPVGEGDLSEISALRPEGWGDITPWFSYYLAHPFFSPFKAVEGGRIAGTGVVIFFGKSAWLAHIIVRPDLRGRGLGSAIVWYCLEVAAARGVLTVSLVATELGFPVYIKAGFRTVCEYTFFSRSEPAPFGGDPHIVPFDGRFRKELLALDRNASGEDRACVLEEHLNAASVYVDGGTLRGFYLPALGEGLVVADSAQAGEALLRLRTREKNGAVIPSGNAFAASVLASLGFAPSGKGTRMVIGESLEFRPEMLFGRTGGNMG